MLKWILSTDIFCFVYILKLMAKHYPSNFRFSTCVFPSPEADDVNVGPYNSMLALNCLIEYADCILPVEN